MKNELNKNVSVVGKIIKGSLIVFLIISVYACKGSTKAKETASVQDAAASVQEAPPSSVQNTAPIVQNVSVKDVVETVIDGQTYTQIDPKKLAFNIDARSVKVGERYVFDDTCSMFSGANLSLSDIGMKNRVKLTEFAEYHRGQRLRVYAVVDKLFSSANMVEFKAVKIIEL